MIFLNVPFSEKDQAKALGARWDGSTKRWYVPEGKPTAPFQQWLPANVVRDALPSATASRVATPSISQISSGSEELLAQRDEVSLLDFMTRVAEAMNRVTPPAEWVRVELTEAKFKPNYGFLSGAEASVQLFMSGSAMQAILKKFAAARVTLEPGIKVLLKLKAEMNPKYGLRLIVLDADPSYTLGDMKAKLDMIRTVLTAEGVFKQQAALPAPTDFTRVAVIAPAQAAGLGDFMAEADQMESWGLCMFDVREAVFQGERAVASILSALSAVQPAATSFDVLVIIRGGGATNDLNWLNDLDLARAVATFPIPVIVGIGHERDRTILDEVARLTFDTPSKVAGHIAGTVITNARNAIEDMQSILGHAHRTVSNAAAQSLAQMQTICTQSLQTMKNAEASATKMMTDVRHLAVQRLDRASHDTALWTRDIQTHARQLVATQQQALDALGREVLGLSPQSTVERGYAIVRQGDNRVITNRAQLDPERPLQIQFRDGIWTTL